MKKLIITTFAAALLAACAVPAPNDGNEKTIFVTSVSFKGNLGGLKGADDKCQAQADDPASIVPSGTYLAWLSDGTDSPNTRFTKSSHPYLLPDGTKIAENYTDLTDGSIQHFINIDPTGKTVVRKYIWTGTNQDGTAAQPFRLCNGWVDLYPVARGMVGSTGHTLTTWSFNSQDRCKTSRHRLACFQQ